VKNGRQAMNYSSTSKLRVQEGRIRENTSTQPHRKAKSISENTWLSSRNKKTWTSVTS
jgi:hypothetical protein